MKFFPKVYLLPFVILIWIASTSRKAWATSDCFTGDRQTPDRCQPAGVCFTVRRLSCSFLLHFPDFEVCTQNRRTSSHETMLEKEINNNGVAPETESGLGSIKRDWLGSNKIKASTRLLAEGSVLMGLPWRMEFYIMMSQYSAQPTISLIYNYWRRMLPETRSCLFTTVIFVTFHPSFDATCTESGHIQCSNITASIQRALAHLLHIVPEFHWRVIRGRWSGEVLPSCGRGSHKGCFGFSWEMKRRPLVTVLDSNSRGFVCL